MGLFNNKKNKMLDLEYEKEKMKLLIEKDKSIKDLLQTIYDNTGITIKLVPLVENDLYLGFEFIKDGETLTRIKTDFIRVYILSDIAILFIRELILRNVCDYFIENNNLKEYSDKLYSILNIKYSMSEIKDTNSKLYYRTDYLLNKLGILCDIYQNMFGLNPTQKTDFKPFTPYVLGIIKRLGSRDIDTIILTSQGFKVILNAYIEFLKFLNERIDLTLQSYSIIEDEEFPKDFLNLINNL